LSTFSCRHFTVDIFLSTFSCRPFIVDVFLSMFPCRCFLVDVFLSTFSCRHFLVDVFLSTFSCRHFRVDVFSRHFHVPMLIPFCSYIKPHHSHNPLSFTVRQFFSHSLTSNISLWGSKISVEILLENSFASSRIS